MLLVSNTVLSAFAEEKKANVVGDLWCLTIKALNCTERDLLSLGHRKIFRSAKLSI